MLGKGGVGKDGSKAGGVLWGYMTSEPVSTAWTTLTRASFQKWVLGEADALACVCMWGLGSPGMGTGIGMMLLVGRAGQDVGGPAQAAKPCQLAIKPTAHPCPLCLP